MVTRNFFTITSWFLMCVPFWSYSLSSGAMIKTTPKQKVVIVGGGVGGLAIASRLASSSSMLDVTILEKNSKDFVGGRCGSFNVHVEPYGTFRHERGPSLLLLKYVYEELFADCSPNGMTAGDFGLFFRQCVPAYQVVFSEDGDSILVGIPDKMDSVDDLRMEMRAKMNSFEESGAEKWDAYMRATSAYLDCGLPNFIEEKLDLASFPNFIFEALKDKAKAWPLLPHSTVLDNFFVSTKMKAMASFQDLYVGLEPYENKQEFAGGVITTTAPAVFGLLAALELHPSNPKCGVYAPIGGFQAVSEAFEKLAESNDVTIKYNSTVTQVTEEGVYLLDSNEPKQSSFIAADLIIVNADLPYATKTLMENDHKHFGNDLSPEHTEKIRFDWEKKYLYSSGVIAFHWSINKTLDCLNTHNVFMETKNARESWETLRIPSIKKKTLSSNGAMNFYVHRATKMDESASPENCDAIMVLVPCETLLRDKVCAKLSKTEAIAKYHEQFSDEMIKHVKSIVLKRLSALDDLKNLEAHIVHEVVDTPATYSDLYNVGAGTPFALSHGFGQLSITRPSSEPPSKKKLLYVGASTRPGNGVPLVLMGAKLVANKAISKLKKAMGSYEGTSK